MALTASLRLKMAASVTGADDFGGPSYKPVLEGLITLASGTLAGQTDIAWFDERQIAPGQDDDIDLSGVLTDAFGSPIAAAELVALAIVNTPRSGIAGSSTLIIGNAPNPMRAFLGGTNPTIGPVRPGGIVFLACGDADGLGAVVAGTGDVLRITNVLGPGVTYQIGILARSA